MTCGNKLEVVENLLLWSREVTILPANIVDETVAMYISIVVGDVRLS
jgi:hypothetical protein